MFSFLKKIFDKKDVDSSTKEVDKDKSSSIKKFDAEAYKDTMSGSYGMTHRELYAYWDNIDSYDVSTIHEEDYSALCNSARLRAQKAIKEKRLNDAWRLLNKEKLYGMIYCEFSSDCPKVTLIHYQQRPHEDMANILRLEKKHIDALINYTYFVTDSEYLSVKYKLKKLKAYFNRAKLVDITFDEYKDFIFSMHGVPDYDKIETKIKKHINHKIF
jgi:hypothetical protein